MQSKSCISLFSLLLGSAALATAVGCNDSFHSGSDVKTLESFKIEKNKTTEKELIAQFGPPSMTTTNGDGSQVLTWSGVDAQSKDSTALILVPFVGGFMAHNDMNAHTCSIMATVRAGIVVDYTIMDSNQKTHLY